MAKYKDFEIREIFHIKTGRDVIISTTKIGDIPLVSHQHDNNGISKYIQKLDNRILFNYKKTIALADRGVFYATTQKENFHIGTRVKALIFKSGEQSENVRLFFVVSINKLQILFEEYLTNATDKLPTLKIKLPVDQNDQIDFAYIENYIEMIKKKSKIKLQECLKKENLYHYELTPEEKETYQRYQQNKVKYNFFKLSELFTSQNGDTDIQQKDINNQGEWIVSSGEYNCGIIGKTNVPAKIFDKNTITVDMFGNVNFRDFKYKMVTHARVFSLKFKNKVLTAEEGLYIVANLTYLKEIYSYGEMASWEKIKDKTILLPVKEENKIDFNFINHFMKSNQKKAIQNAIMYIEKI